MLPVGNMDGSLPAVRYDELEVVGEGSPTSAPVSTRAKFRNRE
jgi:hypothetical protein